MLLRDVALHTMNDEVHVDAALDTGATYCIVPASTATLLGFRKENRLGVVMANAVGGRKEYMDRHALEFVRAGTARAHRIDFLVGSAGPDYRFLMLLGLSFIRRFEAMTLDLAANRVVFRGAA